MPRGLRHKSIAVSFEAVVFADNLADADSGNWDFYCGADASKRYASLDANSSERFYSGVPRLVLYCIQGQLNLVTFRWNRFIDATKHPIQLKFDQEPTLLLSWLAVVEGENNWLPADRFRGKVRSNNGICAGPSRITMTRLDLIEKILKAKSIDAQTTGSDAKSWAAVFSLKA